MFHQTHHSAAIVLFFEDIEAVIQMIGVKNGSC